MNVSFLSPPVQVALPFAWSYEKQVPSLPGNYALVSFAGLILYVGLTTTSLRTRMRCHLDDLTKRQGTFDGVPYWFQYRLGEPDQVARIERGWMNQCVLEDGALPGLNRVFGIC